MLGRRRSISMTEKSVLMFYKRKQFTERTPSVNLILEPLDPRMQNEFFYNLNSSGTLVNHSPHGNFKSFLWQKISLSGKNAGAEISPGKFWSAKIYSTEDIFRHFYLSSYTMFLVSI